VAFPKIKKQILLMEPAAISSPKDFAENTVFSLLNNLHSISV